MKYTCVKYSIIFLIFLILTSCNNKNNEQEVKTYQVNKFPIEENIVPVQESKDDIFMHAYADLKLTKNYVIVVDRKADKILCFLDKENLGYLFSKVSKGKGPNEVLLPETIHLKGDNLLLLDRIKKRLLQYDLKKLNSQDHFFPDRIYNLPILSVVDAKLIEANNIVVSGSVDDGLVCSYDTLGSRLKVLGNVPVGCPIGYNNMGYFNVSNLFKIELFPQSSGFIISSLFSDKLQVFNEDGKEILNITGPDYIRPKFNFISKHFLIDDKSKFGYVDIVIKDRYIYALYMGFSQEELRESDNTGVGNRIFVFEHDGTPVKCFFLNENILTLDVDEENRIFYALQLNPSNKIYKYNYEIQ